MRALAVILLSLAAVACKPQPISAQKPDNKMNAPTQAKPPKPSQTSVDEAPPKPGDVLYVIYQVDGDGASSYPVQNGSIATYWAGHQFTLGGKKYFTGFAYNTPEKYNGNTKADPSAGVTLTEATFELRDPGTSKPWMFIGNEYWIGDFKSVMEQGPKFDGSRAVLEHQVDNGKILIAIPSIDGEAPNLIQRHYELFSFRLGKPIHVEDTRWKYLGQVTVGEDFTAICKAHPDQPCTKWAGDLEFLPATAGTMPDLKVVPHGTTVDDDTGNGRPVADKDIMVFAFKDGKYGFK